MRLLHSTEWRFKDFFDSSTPPYAILSHRWSSDEVSYQELQLAIKLRTATGPIRLPGLGFSKIEACRRGASKDSLQWTWIDTCCINKESSAELSEAINSMYRWYEEAQVCYVYLSDVECRPSYQNLSEDGDHLGKVVNNEEDAHSDISDGSSGEDVNEDEMIPITFRVARTRIQALEAIRKSNWFTRGWTLQELLAPQTIIFYDRLWKVIDSRDELADTIQAATGIENEYLYGKNRHHRIRAASVAKKMSWLAGRSTSRVEDMAYCMLGLFDVNMPLLYGEGERSFTRLQLAIITNNDDESIFAWDLTRDRAPGSPFLRRDNFKFGMLAPAPSNFADSGRVCPYEECEQVVDRLPYAMTNQGLRFEVMVPSEHGDGDPEFTFVLKLNCYEQGVSRRFPVKIVLGKSASGGSKQWNRRGCLVLNTPETSHSAKAASGDSEAVNVTFYVRQSGLQRVSMFSNHRPRPLDAAID
jgi:hypothetical protein